MTRLTPEAERLILAAIRAGAPATDAARAAGVLPGQWFRWLKRGRADRGGWRRRLWREVHKAQGQARAKAAIDVRDQDVKFWLRHGPAKAAWRSLSKVRTADPQRSLADLFGELGDVHEVLQLFPEARQAVVRLIEREKKAN
jgi:hypothetical protein